MSAVLSLPDPQVQVCVCLSVEPVYHCDNDVKQMVQPRLFTSHSLRPPPILTADLHINLSDVVSYGLAGYLSSPTPPLLPSSSLLNMLGWCSVPEEPAVTVRWEVDGRRESSLACVQRV